MISISVADIQKNISLLTKMTDIIEVVDKRRKIKVATIYPANHTNVIEKLAGKYKNRVKKIEDLEKAKNLAMTKAMEEKYGKFN
ncbi:hypothetical protein [Aliarcobacter cryaerophilus]|uniref:hypothetical protein n=1 Tax=Aliarcobacter cryaerophilus TaxID=28198 RepID=UPI0013DDF94D|nr:hypothetical protein [Aliarcobacter cryaerophilus]